MHTYLQLRDMRLVGKENEEEVVDHSVLQSLDLEVPIKDMPIVSADCGRPERKRFRIESLTPPVGKLVSWEIRGVLLKECENAHWFPHGEALGHYDANSGSGGVTVTFYGDK